MEEKHIVSARQILKKIHYINIATVNEDGSPWNSAVSALHDEGLNFFWGSSPDNIHSRNIRRDGRVFVTIYDSTAPEGTGEGLYMRGKAEQLNQEEGTFVCKYKFVPEELWINDEAKNEDGSYKHDIRVSLDLSTLRG
jgi:general stress protein 26